MQLLTLPSDVDFDGQRVQFADPTGGTSSVAVGGGPNSSHARPHLDAFACFDDRTKTPSKFGSTSICGAYQWRIFFLVSALEITHADHFAGPSGRWK